jgi:hypothetical protein
MVGLATIPDLSMNEIRAEKIKMLSTDFRRYRFGRNDPKFIEFIRIVFEFTKRYKLYIDVISNYAREGFFAFKEFKKYVLNFDPASEKRKFIQKNHYICFQVPDNNTLESLINQGADYLEFQFRICDGEIGPMSERDKDIFQKGRPEISELLFEDNRTMAVIKDNYDCSGLRIMFRDDIEEKYRSLLYDIANLKND